MFCSYRSEGVEANINSKDLKLPKIANEFRRIEQRNATAAVEQKKGGSFLDHKRRETSKGELRIDKHRKNY